MARKTSIYPTGPDAGRDSGKTFIITELPASQAESWALRALLALLSDGVDLPAGIETMGMAGMAEVGIRALSGLRWEVAAPLLEEMWQCVTIRPDSSRPDFARELVEQDIEEIATRIKLRAEIWKLHVDFLSAVAPSVSGGGAAAAGGKRPSRNTKTSRQQ